MRYYVTKKRYSFLFLTFFSRKSVDNFLIYYYKGYLNITKTFSQEPCIKNKERQIKQYMFYYDHYYHIFSFVVYEFANRVTLQLRSIAQSFALRVQVRGEGFIVALRSPALIPEMRLGCHVTCLCNAIVLKTLPLIFYSLSSFYCIERIFFQF